MSNNQLVIVNTAEILKWYILHFYMKLMFDIKYRGALTKIFEEMSLLLEQTLEYKECCFFVSLCLTFCITLTYTLKYEIYGSLFSSEHLPFNSIHICSSYRNSVCVCLQIINPRIHRIIVRGAIKYSKLIKIQCVF